VWSESAWAGLEEGASYIVRDSPYYAASLVQKAKAIARSLRLFPERGRHVPEYNNPAVRELSVGTYRLIYRISGDQIVIVAFLHSARDITDLSGPE